MPNFPYGYREDNTNINIVATKIFRIFQTRKMHSISGDEDADNLFYSLMTEYALSWINTMHDEVLLAGYPWENPNVSYVVGDELLLFTWRKKLGNVESRTMTVAVRKDGILAWDVVDFKGSEEVLHVNGTIASVNNPSGIGTIFTDHWIPVNSSIIQ